MTDMEEKLTTAVDGESSLPPPTPPPTPPPSYAMDDLVDQCDVTYLDSAKQIREIRQAFPVKVYEMLEDAYPKDFSHIVSWNAVGTGFMVHNKELFTKQIVPHYFNQTKYKSFQRQLSLYGFQRVSVGPNKGLRYHEKLRRGGRDLVRQMKPVGYKPRGTAKLVENGTSEAMITVEATITITPNTTNPGASVVTVTSADTPSPAAICGPPVAQPKQHLSSPRNLQDETGMAGLPTVVSSNSLDWHGQEPAKTHVQLIVQHQDTQVQQVHLISPEQSPLHVQCGGHSEDESCLTGKEEECEQELQLGLFEGLTFYLMPPTQEFQEEMIPAPCIVNLPPSVIAAVTTVVRSPPTGEGDGHLEKAWQIGFSLESTTPTPSIPTIPSTCMSPSLTALIQTASPIIPAPLPPSPKLLLDNCVDALDFHALDVTTRIN